MRFTSDAQRRAMFAHMKAPQKFINRRINTTKERYAAIGATGIAAGAALAVARHPLGRVAMYAGKIRAIGAAMRKTRRGISYAVHVVKKARLRRMVRSKKTFMAGEAYIFPKKSLIRRKDISRTILPEEIF